MIADVHKAYAATLAFCRHSPLALDYVDDVEAVLRGDSDVEAVLSFVTAAVEAQIGSQLGARMPTTWLGAADARAIFFGDAMVKELMRGRR